MGLKAGIEVTNILYEEKLLPNFFIMKKFKEIAKKKYQTINITKN